MITKRKKLIFNKNRTNRKRGEWTKGLAKMFFWFFLLCFIGAGFWVIFLSPVMQIDTININNQRIDRKLLEEEIISELDGKYWQLFPKKNLLIFPKKKIEQDLLAKFNLIKNISVTRVFPKALLVEIEERKGELIWCVKGECFLVDEAGEAFYKLNPLDKEFSQQEIVQIDDKSQNNILVGKKAVSAQIAKFCYDLPLAFKQKVNVELENKFQTPSTMSMEVRVKTKQGWDVKFSTAERLDVQLQILTEILNEKIGSRVDQLEYVDLRLKGKVAYKFRDVEQTQEQEVDPSAENKENQTQEMKNEESQKKDKKRG